MGHYASKFPKKKKENIERDMTTSAVVEYYAVKFEQDFSLILIDFGIKRVSFLECLGC